MPDSESELHVLEGKYIIYHYGEQDREDEGWALALFCLRNRRMERVYHPAERIDTVGEMGDRHVEELLELMKERGIREVYSVFHLEDFFGIPAHWFSTHLGEEPEEIEEWAEYKSLHKEDYECELLSQNGIKVEFYQEPKD